MAGNDDSDVRYFPKQFRGKRPPRRYIPPTTTEPPPPPPPETRVHWTIALMICTAVVVIVLATVKHFR